MSGSTRHCWRSGQLLVVPNGIDLSGRCIKCGEPSAKAYNRTLYWHHPAYYLFALAGLFLYVILALFIRKTCQVRVGLCARHRRIRTIYISCAWGVFAMAIALFVLAIVIESSRNNSEVSGVMAIVGAVLLLVSAVMGAFTNSLICSPKRITDNYAFIKGPGENVLSDFPEYVAAS